MLQLNFQLGCVDNRNTYVFYPYSTVYPFVLLLWSTTIVIHITLNK